jgi:hypothetical protein
MSHSGSRFAFAELRKCRSSLSTDGPGGADAGTRIERGPDECQ